MKKISPTLKKLVLILNDQQFHSGASLGDALHISRNAIWKQIHQLNELGVAVESLQSKGYQLQQPLILLDEKQIKKNIRVERKPKIEILASVDSTNSYLKKVASELVQFCLAEQQTAGKGRLGRGWYSPFGANIYLSCSWRIHTDVSKLNGLTLVMAIAIVQALQEFGISENLSIKWPNDILYQGKKLAGILVEINAESHGNTQVIIGVGMNVNMPPQANKNISQAWISIGQILKKAQDRNKIAALLITHIVQNLAMFETQGLAPFIKEWQSYDYLADKKINLVIANDTIQGVAKGIDDLGHLRIQRADGKINAYSAGEAMLCRVDPPS